MNVMNKVQGGGKKKYIRAGLGLVMNDT